MFVELSEWSGNGDADPRHRSVTDSLPETPCVARAYCPGCEPDADPSQEILDVWWCEPHSPAHGGADDDLVTASYLSGSAEAGGDDNRRWCDILHGRR
jgi:hypothetical protein